MLQSIISYIVTAILSWVAAKIHTSVVNNQTAAQAQAVTAAVVTQTKAAQTEQDRENAAKSSADSV